MPTSSEIVEQVIDELERPDLFNKIAANFPAAVRSAHRVGEYRKDLKLAYLTSFTNVDGVVKSIIGTDLPNTRKFYHFHEYASFTQVGTAIYPQNPVYLGPYTERQGVEMVRDYYGFEKTKVYSQVGRELILSGVSSQATCIETLALVWPNVVYNSLTQEYDADSWIMEECPELIQAYLRVRAAEILKSREHLQLAMNSLQSVRKEFTDGLAGEII